MPRTKHKSRTALRLAASSLVAGMAWGQAVTAANIEPATIAAGVLQTLAQTHGTPTDVAGVKLPPQVTMGAHTLQLNGAGLRKRFVFDVYVAALYVDTKSQDAATLIQGSAPRRLQLTLLRDIDSKTLLDALNEGLADNSTPQQLAAMQPSIKQFENIMNSAGEGRKGDTIALDMNAGTVAVSFREKALGTVQDPAFSAALMKVWLGDKPAQGSLKKALLGQP